MLEVFDTVCSGKSVFSPRILKILRPHLAHQHWTAIGCTENGQPIGVRVHSDRLSG